MTAGVSAAGREPEERLADRQRHIQQFGVERLLVWGFEPAAIALVLGCSTAYIESIQRKVAMRKERPVA